MMEQRVSVVGAGLAGCEAAFQLAERGIQVDLFEMKPHKMSPAHDSGDFCELVCSNSLRSDRMEISVSDHGPGFLRAGDATLFDMFVRGEIESAKPGVGLGLAICRAIVEAHGGSISASDRAPGGACITFSLPLGEPPLIEEEILPAGEGDAS